MYLKEISATGFKSFADKISIVLDGKTTCIVGPNGSGKSNIVDAVRWVLGEQSVKSLRGDNNMSDIIFSGSKNRNPLNVATVSLTFDNSDNYINLPYNEITVKRRVYRTGENEYFINNEKCRLKDITELFLDTGIGKSSFNIISQGEVQKIISDSPYERRLILESAAGVLKYKKRKEEAIRKLEKTHINMERVDDIIDELQIQIDPLEEQSKKATEYLDIKEKLESIEVALLAAEITNINSEYHSTKEKIEKINNEIMNLNIKSNKSDTTVIEYKTNITKLEEEIKSLNNELLRLTKEEEKLNGEKNLLKERSKYDATDSRIYETISSLNEEKLKIDNNIYLNNQDINLLVQNIDTLTDSLNNKELSLENNRREYTSIFNDINNKRVELSEVVHKVSITDDYINNGGTASNAIKSVLNNPRLRGIHKTLGNLCDTDSKYLKALDIALSSSKQFIVVENSECAKDAINYLKENKLGRATFFPLDVIKPRGIDLDTLAVLQSEKGYISVMIDILKYDKLYHNVISNQLGNVILVDNIDNANRISKKINQKYKIVTLDADVVHVGGSMSGGSSTISKSIFTEKQELIRLNRKKEELTELIKSLEENLNKNLSDKEKLEDLRNKNQIELFKIEETLELKRKNSEELSNKKQEIEQELKSLDNVTNESISKEEERITKEYYETSRKKEETTRQIKNITNEKDKLVALMDEENASNKLNNTNLYSYEKELKNLEISINKMDLKLDANLNILNEEYELTYERARDNYELDIDLDEARQKVNLYKNEIKKIGMVNISSIEDYKRVKERHDFLTSQKNDLLNARDTLLEIIDEMDNVMKTEFEVSFNNIKTEFEKVFKSLFKGGSATLKLTDPKNLLETGVDIVASPPGKKLTSINLLSGGEKTLTAICLIFAILNVKTIPFCLFDEVEAALDEANVDNFGRYLDNYKDKTQFLIITHKKKTMEYAETLYGITMQESGVSKLVSVKLDNIN